MSHEGIRRRVWMNAERDVEQSWSDADLSARPEVVAWTLDADSEGRPLIGAIEYVLHFERGQEPPAHGFWSLVMHDERCLPTDNPLHRYSIGDRGTLTFESDGSLDLFVANTPPAEERRSNWLPAPRGPFHLVLNIYWPRADVLSGVWLPPPVRALDDWPPRAR